MDNINIFFGPNKAFDLFLSENNTTEDNRSSFTSLVRKYDERNREYRHIVNVSNEQIPQKEPLGAKNLIVYSDDYASVREHVIHNFDGFISEFKIDNIYLQNPPALLYQKMKKIYPQTVVKYYQYPKLNEEIIRNINYLYSNEIIGQEDALFKLLVSLIPLTRERNKKPMVILFLGPSGVGKTETAKFLSKQLGGELFRKQLSMFQNNDFMTYLFGGHLYEKSFAKELLERETNVILLDEFDKANSVFHSAFYQLFDEGEFEDKNYHSRVENAIIICTSNYDSPEHIREHLGDPIFSRFDACIEFKALSEESVKKIIDIHVSNEWNNLKPKDKSLLDKDDISNLFAPFIPKIKNARRIKSLVREVYGNKILSSILNEQKP